MNLSAAAYHLVLNQLQAKEMITMLPDKVTTLAASSYCAYLQASNNQRMHVLNGNPDFPGHMEDIDKRPSEVKQFLEGISSLTSVKPINGEGLLHGLLQTSKDSLRDEFHLLSSSVLRDGKIQPNTDIPVPATTLYPRQLRPTCPGPVVNSSSALPVSCMSLSPVQGRPMKITARGQAIKRQQSLEYLLELEDSPEPDAVSLDGYLHSDLELLMGYENFDGMDLCLETWLLKLAALDSILAHGVQTQSLPATIFSAFDTRTRPTVDRAMVSINDSPVFNEDVGGLATPVFPYLGGDGTLSFHLSTRTVPSGDFIFLPPAIITGDKNRTLRLVALFVLMVTEWPFGIFTVHQTTTDDVGGNRGDQVFVPSATTFHIPGSRSVNIIIPRDIRDNVAADQNSNNSAAAVRPQFGSAATGVGTAVHPAHDPMNICWDLGAQPIEYSLTQFLCSWALDFNSFDIMEMVRILGIYSSVTHADLVSALEILRMYTTYFPSLIESNDASETDFVPDSVGGMRVNLLNCTVLPPASNSISEPRVVGGWPQKSQPYAIVMGYAVNIMAFNCAMLDLMEGPSLHISPCWLGKTTTIAQQILGAMQAAVCPQVYYALFGITSEGLTNASIHRSLDSAQDLVQNCFTFLSRPSKMGPFWEFLERKLTGYGHVGIVFNNTSISPYSRQCCPKRFSAVDRDTTIVDGTVPATMVTVWLALFSNELPKSEVAFTTSRNEIIAGYDTVQDPTLRSLTLDVNGTKSTAGFTTAADHLNFYSSDALPSDNLNSLYNIKLAHTEAAHRHYVNYCGKTIEGVTFPATNMLIKQRALPLLPGAVRPGQEADALVGSVPRMTSKGERVVICHDLMEEGRTLLSAEARRGTVQRASLGTSGPLRRFYLAARHHRK